MSVIDDIKKELGEISSNQYEAEPLWGNVFREKVMVRRSKEGGDFIQFKTETEAHWFVKSPERIQVLLEYVEANEDLIALKTLHAIFNKPGGKNLRAARKRAVAARKKLGLA